MITQESSPRVSKDEKNSNVMGQVLDHLLETDETNELILFEIYEVKNSYTLQ